MDDKAYEKAKRTFVVDAVADLIVQRAAEYPTTDFDKASHVIKTYNESAEGFTLDWSNAPDHLPGTRVRLHNVHLSDTEWAQAVEKARQDLADHGQSVS